MPLPDIAIAQSSFQNHWDHTRLQLYVNGKATNYSLLQYKERWASFSKFSQNPGKMNSHLSHCMKLHPKFLVKAVATFDPKISVQSEDGGKGRNGSLCIHESVSSAVHAESSDADSEEIDEKEKSRRVKISKANKGKMPWNKGRKHSPETLQRIRERTKLALQDPKVKVRMKLASLGHAQSQETRDKIRAGVRGVWEKRRPRLETQATCLFDWKNLIAEAARKGLDNEEELQWDSYELFKKQLQQEWLHSIEYRTMVTRSTTNRRAPKSLEQRRKISEAIAAKWADPEYRARVHSGLAKHHGTPEGGERRAKRKPSGGWPSKRTSQIKFGDAEGSVVHELKARSRQAKLKCGHVPKYKDPLAGSKLKMLKNIRAQRVASQTKANETLERAKVLIAEAQKAAKALEVVAMKSPVALGSLIEARRLIAKATQTIENIENGDMSSFHDTASSYHQNHVKKSGNGALTKSPLEEYPNGINGIASLQSVQGQHPDFNLYSLTMLDNMDMNCRLPTRFGGYGFSDLGNFNPSTVEFDPLQTELSRDLDVIDLTHTNRETDSGRVKQESEHAYAVESLDLRALMEQCYHHPEPHDVAKMYRSSAPNGAKVHIHEARAAKTVTKKWVRGKLVEVIEGE